MSEPTTITFSSLRVPYDGPSHPLAELMDMLFEPSSTIENLLPVLHGYIATDGPYQAHNFADVITIFACLVAALPWEARMPLLTAHPAIGQKKKLSAFSAKEQRRDEVVDPGVEERLKRLNLAYEAKYPGLRYVTFVNGRPKEKIAEEMEGLMGVLATASMDEKPIVPYATSSAEWQSELNRGTDAVMAIAMDRANKHLPRD